MQARQITVRNVSAELAEKLRSLAASRGESINTTVLTILRQALDVNERRRRLERYATWSPDDLTEFETALHDQRGIDESLWK